MLSLHVLNAKCWNYSENIGSFPLSVNLCAASNLLDPGIHQRFISVFNGAISQPSPPFPSSSPLFCSPPFSWPLALSSYFLALRLFCWFWGLESEACHYMISNGLEETSPCCVLYIWDDSETYGGLHRGQEALLKICKEMLLWRLRLFLSQETFP